MSNKTYHPEPYWSEVATRIAERGNQNVVAGDDEPYYRYKREKFLAMLNKVDFANKKVLEVGSGPGGNLSFVSKKQPERLVGADISEEMIKLAGGLLSDKAVELFKVNGTTLPFEDDTFDIVFTATVLQHNTDEAMLQKLIAELCRVSSDQVIIFEQTSPSVSGDELCMGRPIEYYEKIFSKHAYRLQQQEYINIYVSYLACGAIRKGLNPATRKEGEPLNKFSTILENALLPITKVLDNVVKVKKDLAKMEFQKIN